MPNASQVTLKRILKCGISLIVFTGSLLRTLLGRCFGWRRKGTCVVLYYHAVPAEERAGFARQLDILTRWTTPLAINEDPPRLAKGVRYAMVTFDDGFEDFIEQALPELQKRNLPSVVFVISDALGKIFGSEDYSGKVMSLVQLQALPESLVTLGSHTITHPMLTRLKKEDARREISGSRNTLQETLRRKVSFFSFPFGDFDESLVEICREAGYRRVFTTLPGFAFENPDEFVVGRVRVDPTDWPLEFRLKLAGAYGWLPRVFAMKRNLVSNSISRTILGKKRAAPTGKAAPSMIRESGAQ